MAHNIMENDRMFSVRELPWHGLGSVLDDYPTLEDAKIHSGLSWTASVRPVYISDEFGGNMIQVPGKYAITRDDTSDPLGLVGSKYTIYQNSEMWDFIEEFQRQSNCTLETAGSLKNGALTWVLASNGQWEAVNGDPINEYFLFNNSFDGSTPIQVLFTNIRVVCNNTLNFALREAKNIFRVKHTASAEGQLAQVQKALGVRATYQDNAQELMKSLAKVQMTESAMRTWLETELFINKKVLQEVGEDEIVLSAEDMSTRGETMRQNNIDSVMSLVEVGAGADINHVQGTAYGLVQAIIEWADHEKTIRYDGPESRFNSAWFGSSAKWKQEAVSKAISLV